ncbi:MAG: DNA translocase FtsK [Pseudomonadota bacterium]
MDREEFVRANQHSLAIESVMKRMKSPGQVTETVVGPMVVTQYFTPGSGVKKSDVQKVNEDIARALKVGSIRIVAVEGKQDILIEVPRLNRRIVDLGELMQSETYAETGAELPVILGRDTQDEICVIDLSRSIGKPKTAGDEVFILKQALLKMVWCPIKMIRVRASVH